MDSGGGRIRYIDYDASIALPLWFLAASGLVIGAVVGSYLATILWRWPAGGSANRGRSRCDGCDRGLRWFEIIPLAGRVLTRGRCRSCGHAIGWQHALIEAACAVLGAICFAAGAFWLAPLAWLLILLFWFDARHLWLPNALVGAAAVFAIAVPPFTALGLPERLIGGAIGFGFLWLVAAGYRRIRGHDGLGGGDAKLFGAIGLWVGPLSLPLVLLSACALGLVDLAMRLAGGGNPATLKLPLGTYLAAATLGFIVFYCGQALAVWAI